MSDKRAKAEAEAGDRLDKAYRYKITMVGNIHSTTSSIIELDRLVRNSIYHGFIPTVEVLCKVL